MIGGQHDCLLKIRISSDLALGQKMKCMSTWPIHYQLPFWRHVSLRSRRELLLCHLRLQIIRHCRLKTRGVLSLLFCHPAAIKGQTFYCSSSRGSSIINLAAIKNLSKRPSSWRSLSHTRNLLILPASWISGGWCCIEYTLSFISNFFYAM